ncbi:MAG: DUF3253 domain-containing protein [Pseudomonadota bacterium]
MDDKTLKVAILEAVRARGSGKTICPSEVARHLEPDWRYIMPDIRRVGQALADQGYIVVTQNGHLVRALEAKGPIRFGLPGSFG